MKSRAIATSSTCGKAGMGLPERDYYVGTSGYFGALRTAYREHVATMFTLLGDAPEQPRSCRARPCCGSKPDWPKLRTPVQLRDREAQYNLRRPTSSPSCAPKVNWDLYLKTIDVEHAAGT